jgi:hypothetical protein
MRQGYGPDLEGDTGVRMSWGASRRECASDVHRQGTSILSQLSGERGGWGWGCRRGLHAYLDGTHLQARSEAASEVRAGGTSTRNVVT